MTEHRELDSRFNEHIENLKNKAQELHTTASDYDAQVEYWNEQRKLFEEYGAKLPLAMQCAQFMIEQIATATTPPVEDLPIVGMKARIIRPGRRIVSKGKREDRGKFYNIPPQVKSIMNGIFGRGAEDIPEYLESLFDRMYGLQWHSKTIGIPVGPRVPHITRTYLEDLKAEDSYLRRLISGADWVINRKMRSNTPPDFPFRGRVAAVELKQLYNQIDAVGWNVYDDFMVRNEIRQSKT